VSPIIKSARLQLPLILALLVGSNGLRATDVIQGEKLNRTSVKQLKQKKEKGLQKKKKKLSQQKKVVVIAFTTVTIVFIVATGGFFYFRSSSEKTGSPLHEEFITQQPNQPEESEAL